MRPSAFLPGLLPTLALAAAPLQEAEPLQAYEPAAMDEGFGAPTVSSRVTDSARDLIDGSLLLDEPGDGRVWGVGRTWKASFGHDGFTYVPFLGSDAPRSYPVSLDLDAVTISGESLGIAGAPTASIDGTTVHLDRGTLVETYHLAMDSVEQTFVFHDLPAGAGEIVLRLDVKTDLEARAAGEGFVFAGDLGHVAYGAATAYDAAGRSLALHQSLVDGGIEIVVPTDFVDAAALPLVVDPVVTTVPVTNNSREYTDVDVAYDAQSGVYQIVLERVESLNDSDVFAVFYNTGLGGFLGTFSSIDITTDAWRAPRVAANYQEQEFLTVAARGSIGGRAIVGRMRNAVSGVRGSQFTISPVGDDHLEPDVGGFTNDTNTLSDFVVTWQRNIPFPSANLDIVAQAVSASSALTGSLVTIAGGTSNDDRSPRISRGSGQIALNAPEHKYMITWERDAGGGERRVYARVVDFNLVLTGHPVFRAYDILVDARRPDVSTQDVRDGGEPFWVIAFERLKGGDYEIYTVVAQDGTNFNGNDISDQQDVGQTTEQRRPRIAFDGQDYMITYQSEDGMGGWDAYMTVGNIAEDGNGELRMALVERITELRAPDGSVEDLAIASRWDGGDNPGGGPSNNSSLAVWTGFGDNGTDLDVGAAVVVETAGNVVGRQYCNANENVSGASAWMSIFGGQSALQDHILRCQDLPANTFGYFIVGDGSAVTFNPGGSAGNLCVSGSVGRYSNFVASSGPEGILSITIDPQAIPQSNGTVAAVPGETWFFQCWTRDNQGGMPTSNFSNGVSLAFRP
ncbi:MAG: hypothetical protein AAGB93_01135 [Planctomycetota bacterium]